MRISDWSADVCSSDLFARERQIPYFGICFGMQMAVIEAARHLAGLPQAGSTEFGAPGDPVVGLMTEWSRGNEVERRNVRSEERRVGKECVRPGRSRGSPDH